MVLKNIPLEKTDFDSLAWEEVINECGRKECHSYESGFIAKAKEAAGAGDDKAQEIFTLLGAICSLHFKSEDKDEPFGPQLVVATGRSLIVDDLTVEHLLVLKEIVYEIQDFEIRARIADILWLKKRDFMAAGIAVDSYLESAKNLESPGSWPPCFKRIERAYRLGTQLGLKAGLRDKIVTHIEEVLDKYNGEDPLYLSAKLMELLLEQKLGDPVKYSALADKVALRAEDAGNFTLSRICWEIKARWNELAGDTEAKIESNIKAAETYAKEAEQAGSNLVAATSLEKSIQAFRRVGGQKERVNQLHDRLVEVQKKISSEMQEFYHEVPIGGLIQRNIDRVKNKTFKDAIFEFCIMASPSDVSDLRRQVEETTNEFQLKHLFSRVLVNENGKVIGRHPDMMSSDPAEVEKAKRAEMFSHAQINFNVYTQALIEPVRNHININHRAEIRDFHGLIRHSPFVPENREYLYARGLHAGLQGDYIASVHFLVPQIENSIRYLLEQKGITVSKVDDQGIQNERDLNDILYDPALKKVLGENLVFDLQGLFVERFGANLRNRLAHGLISDNGFYSVDVPYFWWLTLRLVCLPLIAHLKKHKVAEKTGQGAEGEE
jgi:hypothetical protein